MNHAELIARLKQTNQFQPNADVTTEDVVGVLERLTTELAALKAEKAERDGRDYAAYVNDDGFIVERDLSISPGEKLYLAPGAGSVLNEADELLRKLHLDPDTYRTDGGALNHMKIRAALLHPGQYPTTGAGSVPMTDAEAASMLDKAQTAWDLQADEYNRFGALGADETTLLITRAVEAHHKIGVKP